MAALTLVILNTCGYSMPCVEKFYNMPVLQSILKVVDYNQATRAIKENVIRIPTITSLENDVIICGSDKCKFFMDKLSHQLLHINQCCITWLCIGKYKTYLVKDVYVLIARRVRDV